MVEQIYKDFERKKAELVKKPEFREQELSPEKEKEILKEAISEHVQKTQISPGPQPKIVAQKTQQIKIQPKERQVQLLVNLAFDKGLSHAIEVAKRLENPYLLDEFHDTLVDELYNKLVQEGKLKQL